MLLGQLHAALADRVDARDRLDPRVEHEVAPLGLPVREDLQQDQRAHDRVQDLGVVEGLVGVIDRLAVEAEAVLGVVLDLDRQVAADGLDEHHVLDVDVRVLAADVVVAGRRRPLEVVRGRTRVLAVAAVVDVADPAARQHVPVEDLDVVELRADLEHREQPGLRGLQALEPGVLVVLVEVGEVLDERFTVEQAGDRAGGHRIDRLALRRRRVEALQREHVLERDLLLEPEEHVVAEQQVAADLQDVGRHAVVLGAHPLVGDHRQLGAAEGLLAAGVQRVGPVGQLLALRDQAGADDLVAAAVETVARGGLLAVLALRHGLPVTRGRALWPWPAGPRACA